nr:hypothetical protein [Tanacetum cinerariifolium]
AFSRNQFCFVYHKTLKGWKTCRSCLKEFHCGCFASSLYDEINNEFECGGCVAQHANLNQKKLMTALLSPRLLVLMVTPAPTLAMGETNDGTTITPSPRANGDTSADPGYGRCGRRPRASYK